MPTGENEQALRKIIDFTRFTGIIVLLLHSYLICYAAFAARQLTHPFMDKVLAHIYRLPIFADTLVAKSAALGLIIVSLLGTKGRKSERIKRAHAGIALLTGLALYYGSGVFMPPDNPSVGRASAYISGTAAGLLLFLRSASLFCRLIRINLGKDIFNLENETFPQEERKLENDYAINLPAKYQLKGKARNSWVNIINPFRGTLVQGTPGAGKSYFIIRHIITQHIKKGFAMLIYDFKYDDLSRIAYNTLLNHNKQYPVRPQFFMVNFEDLDRSHRCNPLAPAGMRDITDAMESARTFMLGLNREWIKKQGDFFVESPINFVTALIWFLKKYQDGRCCTLPHIIELAQLDYRKLFAVLKTEPEIEVLVNPFVSAWQNEAFDQLEGQVASAKISLARLVSPSLYYILSGNDFSLDLNDPASPKIICLGNNPLKQQVYGAVLSLYVSRTVKLVNQKNRLKCNLIFDEFPTIYFNNIDSLIATARSNKVATTLAVQDYSQLKKDYGREQAEVIMNIVGNILSGQVSGETAKQLSERIGKIVQRRDSVTINSQDTSVNQSTQLDYAVPASKIASLSSGCFAGVVADDPDNRVDLKAFHNEIINDHAAIQAEEKGYKELPRVRQVDDEMVMANYFAIKKDIRDIVSDLLGADD